MIETATTRGMEGFDRRAFTVDDVQRMLEAGILDWDEKFELIRGEIVPMNSQLSPHSQMKARILRRLSAATPDDCLIANDVTVRLPNGLFEPDVLIWNPIKQRAFIPLSAALIAVEVSDTTLRRDLTKSEDYVAGGLGELWIVDLNARETLVFRQARARETVPFNTPLSPLFAPALSLTIAELE